jgi:hypothetical protein
VQHLPQAGEVLERAQLERFVEQKEARLAGRPAGRGQKREEAVEGVARGGADAVAAVSRRR